MSKRSSPVDQATASAAPKPKRGKVEFDFDSKFIATSQDDLDIGLLRVQNRRLAERINQKNRIEGDLRSRIDNLEKKQLTDDTKLYAINRYWNQLNEDMRLILQRLDACTELHQPNDGTQSATSPENEDSNESPTSLMNASNKNDGTSNFMKLLTNCDKEELDEALQQRAQLSKRAVAKILQAFERLVHRNEQVMNILKAPSSVDVKGEIKEEDPFDEPSASSIKSPKSPPPSHPGNTKLTKKTRRQIEIDEAVRAHNEELTKENIRLNDLVTSLHGKHHVLNAQNLQIKDQLEAKDLLVDELKNRVDELEFELNKSKTREQRLEDHFYEAREKLRDIMTNGTPNVDSAATGGNNNNNNGKSSDSSSCSSNGGKMEELRRDLEEQREMAQSRLVELEQLNADYKNLLKETEKYKFDLTCLPESAIVETAEYKSLQAHFSVLFNETVQLQNLFEDTRNKLMNAKNAHLKQIEHMEAEELQMQKKLRSECMQLQDAHAQVKKDYEMLRLEFEQTLAANEQTGPINREMRHLITSLQNHTQQLKGECARLKKKLKESQVECFRLRAIIEEHTDLKVASGGLLLPDPKLENPPPPPQHVVKQEELTSVKQESNAQVHSDCSNDGPLVIVTNEGDDQVKKEVKIEVKQEQQSTTPPHYPHQHPPQPPTPASASNTPIKKNSSPLSELESDLSVLAGSSDGHSVVGHSHGHGPRPDLEAQIRELKAQLKKSLEAQRELKLLLDMFKSVDKEKREKAQLMASDKKLRMELEEMRQQIKRHQEQERRGDKRRLTDEEYSRKVAKYEEVIAQLQKNVTAHKQEEETLLNEMEVTGQAFEDMQEQNIRLLQQLREKDDANFKLISERIKSNAIQKMLKEEKDVLSEQINAMQSQIDAQNQVVRKLEEKERLQQNNLSTLEKELGLRQNAMDYHKRKAIESAQTANDLKMHLDKYVTQMKDAQDIVADKTSAWQQETFKTKRLNEELQMYKRKYERAKKFELATTADEVLQEEIRELKEELTCPSCKTKRKDAVLNKCFHVFCYDCLKTRYETRQRKCPKCNQSFSANDFHRLYLA